MICPCDMSKQDETPADFGHFDGAREIYITHSLLLFPPHKQHRATADDLRLFGRKKRGKKKEKIKS